MPRKYRFHLISLAHLPQSKTYLSCAFTQKNRKLAKMLTSLGHTVFFYGSEGSDVEEYCNSDSLHFIQTHTLEDIRSDYGVGDNRFEVGYDWTNGDFKHDFDKQRKPSTLKFLGNCAESINRIKKPDDFVLFSQAYSYYGSIFEQVKLFLNCESGIGYRGSTQPRASWGFWARSFESSYIQNFTYGAEHPRECASGNYYDRVIPNYFDDEDIEYSPEKKDYYLFIGRMIARKGIEIATKTCDILGKKLIIVGQGGCVTSDGSLSATDAPDFCIPRGTWEYQGYADVGKRKKLMAHAIATFTPTIYLEAFGGTHVESMLSGTPVITTNFGVYPGTFRDGVGGYHCDTLDDFVWAARQAQKMNPSVVRASSERYLMDFVRWEFQKWFDDLYQVYISTQGTAKGWHNVRKHQEKWREILTPYIG